MKKKATIQVRPGIDDAVETKKYRETVKLLKTAFIEQTKDSLTKILDRIEEKTGSAFGKAENGELIINETAVRNAVNEEINPLDEFIDSLSIFLFYIWAFNVGGNDFLQAKRIPVKFDLRNEQILELIRGKTDLLIQVLDKTTKNFIAEKIIEGIKSGLTKNQVTDSIRDILPETYAKRAETVAYTEMSNMVNASELETATRNNAVAKRWITVGDDLVDEICEANEAEETININDSFQSGDMRPPAHPNCRCVLEFDVINLGYFWNGG